VSIPLDESGLVGCRVAKDFVITEALWDNPGRGRYRGLATNVSPGFKLGPGAPVLIAITAPQPAALAADLLGELPYLTSRLATGAVEAALGGDAMVEAEPPGRSLADWRSAGLDRADILSIGAEVAAIAALAHQRNLALGGLRPELIYASRRGRLTLTAIAPRALEFFRTGGPLDAGNIPAFEDVLEPIEQMMANRPATPASDVFTLAAGLGLLASGQHPFAAGGWPAQVHAMGERDGRWAEDDPLLRLLERALFRTAAARINAVQLRHGLAALAG
jgi:hypothetical protein